MGQFVRDYIERVVNHGDLTGVDELVSPTYRGSGDVQETVELGDDLVARALAGGTVTVDGVQRRRRIEWLALYRVTGGLIDEINLLAVVPLDAD